MSVEDKGPLLAGLTYQFRQPQLLKLALTHRSRVNESDETENNERLEFLGDAVLDLVLSHLLFTHYGDASEGELSKLRASLVNKGTLAVKGRRLGIGPAMRMGQGEERTGGREKDSLLADAFEAIIASIYLDGGFAPAYAFVAEQFATDLPSERGNSTDPKTELQQYCQKQFHLLPVYMMIEEQGPEHERTFTYEVTAGALRGVGSGKSKKVAEQAAALAALSLLVR